MSRRSRGIRVLDLTNVLAGPFCAYQLALLGAEVIKVEVPDERRPRAPARRRRRRSTRAHMGASFLAQNGGKKSITLNLKSARRQGGAAPPGRVGRRAGRELPPRRDGPARARLRRRCARSTRARLLRDLRLRPGRADEGRAGLRPDHPGPVGHDEHHRRRATARRCAPAIRWPTRSAASRRRSRSRPRWCGATRTGEGVVHRRLDARLGARRHGLGGVELPDRRRRAAARTATTTSPPRRRARSSARDGLLNIAANKQEQFEALVKRASAATTWSPTRASPSARRASATARR